MDNRQFILLSVFCFSLFMLWQGWVSGEQSKLAPSVAANTTSTLATTVPNATTANASSTLPAAVGTVPAVTQPSIQPAAATVTVRTDVIRADFSSQGGDLVRLELLKHRTDDKQSNLVLIDPALAYSAQSGLIGAVEGVALPNHKTPWQIAAGNYTLADTENTVRLTMTAPLQNGVSVARTYIFHRGSYLVDVTYDITNSSTAAINPAAYFQLLRSVKEAATNLFAVATFTGPAFYTEAGKFQKLAFGDILKGKGPQITKADDGWVALVQHYFVSAWLPPAGPNREFFAHKVDNEHVTAGIVLSGGAIAPGSTGQISAQFYAGPQIQDQLERIAPGFVLVVDYGWLTLIAAPIFWLLEMIHKICGNWGWSIILLTVLIKALFFPLSAASYKSMAKMRVLTPKLMKLKETYGDDKQRLNTEMMALYKREKVNPLGGCLPILVQIPVFIALYWVLLGSVEMRQAPWLGWLNDLSAADPYYILPLLMGATMLAQTKLNPTPPDPIQAKVMMAMPIVFTAMFITFPSGLVLYWTVNNLLSIAQQWQINRMIEAGADKKPT